MEKISDIPLNDDTKLTAHENEILNKYFDGKEKISQLSTMTLLKIALYGSILMLLVSNQWIDVLIKGLPIPYNDNMFMSIIIKFVLFFGIFCLTLKYGL